MQRIVKRESFSMRNVEAIALLLYVCTYVCVHNISAQIIPLPFSNDIHPTIYRTNDSYSKDRLFDAITCLLACVYVPFRLAFYANNALRLFKRMCAFMEADVLNSRCWNVPEKCIIRRCGRNVSKLMFLAPRRIDSLIQDSGGRSFLYNVFFFSNK